MTVTELELTLPNGFHDAGLIGFEVNLQTAKATLWLLLDVSDTDSEMSTMRSAALVLSGLDFFRCDGVPRARTFRQPDALPFTLSGFNPTSREYPGFENLSPEVRGQLFGFYVLQWNGFIFVAAEGAEILWDVPGTAHGQCSGSA